MVQSLPRHLYPSLPEQEFGGQGWQKGQEEQWARLTESDAEPKLVDDFPTEVKDWLFRRVRLNSDITGIIRLQPLYLSAPLP